MRATVVDILRRIGALDTVTPRFHSAALEVELEQVRSLPLVNDSEREALEHVMRSIPAFRMALRRYPELLGPPKENAPARGR
jgi:hypothetical protein